MEYRRLGRAGLKVSVLSFGSWVTFKDQMAVAEARFRQMSWRASHVRTSECSSLCKKLKFSNEIMWGRRNSNKNLKG